MKNKTAERKNRGPDFSLVTARIRKEILEGKGDTLCRRVLARKDVWKKIDPEKQVEWARPRDMVMPETGGRPAKVFVHPRLKKWADACPELMSLEKLCPPVGQIIAACRGGMQVSFREEKVLLQTVGFLPRASTLIHHLLSRLPDYNPHMVDFKLSRLRGTPLGCRRIHSLLGFEGDFCPFDKKAPYPHPLLHLDQWNVPPPVKAEKVKNLSEALENLKAAISRTEAFLK